MYQGIFHDGEWKDAYAFLPMKTEAGWIWLKHYQVRKVTFMVPEKGFAMAYRERRRKE